MGSNGLGPQPTSPLDEVRRMISHFEQLRRRAKCRKLKQRYSNLIARWKRAEEKLTHVK
jgi:hypothetical protein